MEDNKAKIKVNQKIHKDYRKGKEATLDIRSQNELWEEATVLHAIMSVKIKVPGLKVDRMISRERREAENNMKLALESACGGIMHGESRNSWIVDVYVSVKEVGNRVQGTMNTTEAISYVKFPACISETN